MDPIPPTPLEMYRSSNLLSGTGQIRLGMNVRLGTAVPGYIYNGINLAGIITPSLPLTKELWITVTNPTRKSTGTMVLSTPFRNENEEMATSINIWNETGQDWVIGDILDITFVAPIV
jgi:hypothetical protein